MMRTIRRADRAGRRINNLKSVGGHADGAVRPRAVSSSATTSWSSREEIFPALARQRSSASVRLFHPMHGCYQEQAGEIVECAPPMIRRRGAATRRTVAKSSHAALGLSLACAGRGGAALRPLFTHETPHRPTTGSTHLNPHSLDVQRTAKSSRALPPQPGLALPVRAPRILQRRPRLEARRLVFNRTVSLRDTGPRSRRKAANSDHEDRPRRRGRRTTKARRHEGTKKISTRGHGQRVGVGLSAGEESHVRKYKNPSVSGGSCISSTWLSSHVGRLRPTTPTRCHRVH